MLEVGQGRLKEHSQSFVPLGVFSSNFWTLGAMARSSSLRLAVIEKFRGLVTAPRAVVSLIGLEEAADSLNDLADLRS
jgi:hypothetical protein